jgi:hypothetical protein
VPRYDEAVAAIVARSAQHQYRALIVAFDDGFDTESPADSISSCERVPLSIVSRSAWAISAGVRSSVGMAAGSDENRAIGVPQGVSREFYKTMAAAQGAAQSKRPPRRTAFVVLVQPDRSVVVMVVIMVVIMIMVVIVIGFEVVGLDELCQLVAGHRLVGLFGEVDDEVDDLVLEHRRAQAEAIACGFWR